MEGNAISHDGLVLGEVGVGGNLVVLAANVALEKPEVEVALHVRSGLRIGMGDQKYIEIRPVGDHEFVQTEYAPTVR